MLSLSFNDLIVDSSIKIIVYVFAFTYCNWNCMILYMYVCIYEQPKIYYFIFTERFIAQTMF